MKIDMNVSGTSFSVHLTPETADEKDALMSITSGQFTFQFSGHQYMDPSFRFYAYRPSND